VWCHCWPLPHAEQQEETWSARTVQVQCMDVSHLPLSWTCSTQCPVNRGHVRAVHLLPVLPGRASCDS
jgi:hypothetical protein